MRTLILCYHSQNILGNDYHSNDHIALASDLNAILRRGLPVISLQKLLDYLNGRWRPFPRKAVVLTCDDGTLLDWHDYQHPQFGHQPSFDRILRGFLAAAPKRQNTKGIMTSFVIASPRARHIIDQQCYAGAPLSTDDWWDEAARSGRWLFGNHSWDHRHACLADTLPGETLGQFYAVNHLAIARKQIAQASEYLKNKLPDQARINVFAYPYGHSNEFLAELYLPRHGAEHGLQAAVTTTPGIIERRTSRFLLPRYTCGEDWQSPEQFEHILDQL